MRIAYINPNSTASMTDGIVRAARAAAPEAEIIGLTNQSAPAAIQGQADGDAALPGLLALLPQAVAQGADVIVIACFDDTGLAQARAASDVPVLGIGQACFVTAQLLGLRFSVVTSLAVSIPVIEENIASQGFSGLCASVRASGLPVLRIDMGGAAVVERIVEEIATAVRDDAAECAILGCAGMAHLLPALRAQCSIPLIEGIGASAGLARALIAAS